MCTAKSLNILYFTSKMVETLDILGGVLFKTIYLERTLSFFLLKYLFPLSKHDSKRESKLAPSNNPKNPPTSATKLEKPYNSYCSITCT